MGRSMLQLALFCMACVCASALNTAPAPAPGMEASCTLTPELEEGPYYLDDVLFRSNITEDQVGIPLILRIKVVNTDCEPLVDTFVDIWQCNGTGFYSGYTLEAGAGDSGQTSASTSSMSGMASTPAGSPAGAPSGTSAPSSEAAPSGTMATSSPEGSAMSSGGSSTTAATSQSSTTDTLTWLRGILQTDEDGIAEFETIVPGWYSGRAPHIHIKIHVPYNTTLNEYDQYEDSHLVHTSQLFFLDSLYNQIAVLEPYVGDTVTRVLTTNDRVYAADTTAVMDVTQDDSTLSDGLVASITAVIDESATPTAASEADSSQSAQGGSSTTTSAPSIPSTGRRLLAA